MLANMLKISITHSLIGIYVHFAIERIVLVIQIVCSHLVYLMLATALQPLEYFYQKR